MKYKLQNMFQSEIGQDEKQVWTGHPSPGRMKKVGIPILIFGIIWSGFIALFFFNFIRGIASDGNGFDPFNIVFIIFMLPFVVAGIGMLSSPLWISKLAENMLYAITDKRCIIIICWWKIKRIRSYHYDKISSIQRLELKDGTGDINFNLSGDTTYINKRQGTLDRALFMGIKNSRMVEEMILNEMNKVKKS